MASTGEFFGLRIKGSSMEPRIRDGDVVIVRRQEDAETSDTAVILVNGDSATVKRIKKDPDGSLWLLPNNPAYDPQHYSPAEIATLPVRIIGKVVELRGKF
jgi:repressor LexA